MSTKRGVGAMGTATMDLTSIPGLSNILLNSTLDKTYFVSHKIVEEQAPASSPAKTVTRRVKRSTSEIILHSWETDVPQEGLLTERGTFSTRSSKPQVPSLALSPTRSTAVVTRQKKSERTPTTRMRRAPTFQKFQYELLESLVLNKDLYSVLSTKFDEKVLAGSKSSKDLLSSPKSGCIHLEDMTIETGENISVSVKNIQSGDLPSITSKLIEWVTCSDEHQQKWGLKLVGYFLLCYPLFSSFDEVLLLLKKKYNQAISENTKKIEFGIYVFLQKWIELRFFPDFATNYFAGHIPEFVGGRGRKKFDDFLSSLDNSVRFAFFKRLNSEADSSRLLVGSEARERILGDSYESIERRKKLICDQDPKACGEEHRDSLDVGDTGSRRRSRSSSAVSSGSEVEAEVDTMRLVVQSETASFPSSSPLSDAASRRGGMKRTKSVKGLFGFKEDSTINQSTITPRAPSPSPKKDKEEDEKERKRDEKREEKQKKKEEKKEKEKQKKEEKSEKSLISSAFRTLKKHTRDDPQEFLDFKDVREFAVQMTLYESTLASLIDPQQLLLHGKATQDHSTPLSLLTQRSKKMNSWVATEILTIENVKKRAEALKRFILIANECWNLRNYHDAITLVQIIASNPGITRLKQTWERISVDTNALFERLQEHISSFHNFQNYRKELYNAISEGLPCIPFLGLVFRDLVAGEENDNFVTVGGVKQINFHKIRIIGRTISDFLSANKLYGMDPPTSREAVAINRYIRKMFNTVVNEDARWAMSQKIEPSMRESPV